MDKDAASARTEPALPDKPNLFPGGAIRVRHMLLAGLSVLPDSMARHGLFPSLSRLLSRLSLALARGLPPGPMRLDRGTL